MCYVSASCIMPTGILSCDALVYIVPRYPITPTSRPRMARREHPVAALVRSPEFVTKRIRHMRWALYVCDAHTMSCLHASTRPLILSLTRYLTPSLTLSGSLYMCWSVTNAARRRMPWLSMVAGWPMPHGNRRIAVVWYV